MPKPFVFGKKAPVTSVSIQRDCYAMASTDGISAEITMYGEIVETQPVDWWDGQPIPGSYIIQSEFMEDLKAVEGCQELTIRMNSCGGDAAVSILIHNRLRELSNKGVKLTCIVDGVAMSGGSLIMCACDTVKVNPSSLIMIHKCWACIWGNYNADELRKAAASNDSYDKAQVAVYKRKCGLSETVILHMMAENTYMTGEEAVEKGFADEVLEDAEPLELSASEDGRNLFIRGRKVCLTPGLFAPDNIPTALKASPAAAAPAASAGVVNKKEPEQPAPATENKEAKVMANTVEELRQEAPDLTRQLETAASANAVQAERQRQQEIDAVAGLFDDALVQEARYGEHACTAQELTYRAAQRAAKQGSSFMKELSSDAEASGAAEVTAAPAPDALYAHVTEENELTGEQKMKNARTVVSGLFKKED